MAQKTKKRPHKAGKCFVCAPIVSQQGKSVESEHGVIESAFAAIFQAVLTANTDLRRYGVTQRLRSSIQVIADSADRAKWITDYTLAEQEGQ